MEVIFIMSITLSSPFPLCLIGSQLALVSYGSWVALVVLGLWCMVPYMAHGPWFSSRGSLYSCFLGSWFLLRMDSFLAYGIRDLGLFLSFFPTVDDLAKGQSWRLCCGILELGGKKSDQPY